MNKTYRMAATESKRKMTTKRLTPHKPSSAKQVDLSNQAVLQLLNKINQNPRAIQAIAKTGIQGHGGKIPHLDRIQAAFGKYDVSAINAYVNPSAATASKLINAKAYTMANKIAFADSQPSLFEVAHEAAHYFHQQSAIPLKNNVGQVGDQYERHANAVADAVVQGKSAEALLETYTPQSPHLVNTPTNVQRILNIGKKKNITAKEVERLPGNKQIQAVLKQWAEDDKDHTFTNQKLAKEAAEAEAGPSSYSKDKVVAETNLYGIPNSGFAFKDKEERKLEPMDFEEDRTLQGLIEMSSIFKDQLEEDDQKPIEVQSAFSSELNSLFIATNNAASSEHLLEEAKDFDAFLKYLSKDLDSIKGAPYSSKASHAKRKKAKFNQRVIKSSKQKNAAKRHAKGSQELIAFFQQLQEAGTKPEVLPEDLDQIKSDKIYISTKKRKISDDPDAADEHAERDFIPVYEKVKHSKKKFTVGGVKIPCATCGHRLHKSGIVKKPKVSKFFLNQLEGYPKDPQKTKQHLAEVKDFMGDEPHYLSNGFGYLSDSDYEPDEDDVTAKVKRKKIKKKKDTDDG